jgi:cyclohexanone monooxygenase
MTDGANLNSWFVGRNIAGKLATPLFYFGGANNYFDEIDKEIQSDFPGLEVSNPDPEIRPRVAC